MPHSHVSDHFSSLPQLRVSELNRIARELLEGNFQKIWVEGEISNLARPNSGHYYFSLKDENAQIRCALFRNRAVRLPVTPKNGQQVKALAKVSLFEPRGDYQLIVDTLQETGAGALEEAFQALKRKLAKEGLFAVERKKTIPRFARHIGVITSPTGAAIRDVLSVLKRRFPALPVTLYPTPVQGIGAAESIARAINNADYFEECDVLLLVRGGGSIEDLWSFNEEIVARAIVAGNTPIITGVGHEIDFTIADFAADVRAPTPSAAAELVSPDRQEWLSRFSRLESRLTDTLQRRCQTQQQLLDNLQSRLLRVHPKRRLQDHHQRLEEWRGRLTRIMDQRLEHNKQRLQIAYSRLLSASPKATIATFKERFQGLEERLSHAQQNRLDHSRRQLAATTHALQTVSPLATLERGYSVLRSADQRVIRDAGQVKKGDNLEVILHKGRLQCRVTDALIEPQ